MREGWCAVKLGEISTKRTDFTRVDPEVQYAILGVQRSGWGFVKRDPILGSEMKFTKLMQLEENDLVYRTITAFEAPSAVTSQNEAGYFVTPQTFPVFKVDESQILPAYLSLLTTWPFFHEEMSSRCTGSVLRRKTLSVGAFQSIPVALPPLAEQRRIVDLIGALDDAIDTARGCRDAVAEALEHLRVLEIGDTSIPLGDLVTMRSGPSWKSQDEDVEPGLGLEPVLGIMNTPVGSTISMLPQKFVRGIPATAQRLTKRSLIMIRTNGNRSRIGNVYRSTPEAEGYAVSAFQIAIEPMKEVDPAFLYWYLGSRHVQNEISDRASGSTGLGNIAIGQLKLLPIPVLAADAQALYVARCEAAHNVLLAAQEALEHLQEMRSHVLTALLSGEHEIPESYDEVMELSA